jgi:transcriptional regulator of arginine metabolism
MAVDPAARRLELRRLVEGHPTASQNELARLLARRGYRVTQSTVSRDLSALGAVKVRDEGEGRYVITGQVQRRPVGDLRRVMAELVRAIEASGSLVLVKTAPGAAATVAGYLDRSGVEGVLGTVAGDDTLLAVGVEGVPGTSVVRRLKAILEGKP